MTPKRLNSVIFFKRIYRRNLPWKRFSSLPPHRLELGDSPNHPESTITPSPGSVL